MTRRCTAGGDRLHIAHVVHSATFGGVERYIATTIGELVRRGHAATVIGDPELLEKEATEAGAAFVSAPSRVDLLRALARRSSPFDVIHAHMTVAEAAATATRPVLRKPIVCTRHFAARRGSSPTGRVVSAPIRRSIHTQISTSRFVADAIGEPSIVIHHGVPNASAADPADQQLVVLVAQRLEAEKRTTDALRAWEQSALADDGWELWISGEGSERGRLEEQAARLRGVRFLGHRDDVEELSRRASLFLATTPADAFGLGVVEAMSCALPVAAAGGGGHLETVGAAAPELLYPPGDAEACAMLLRRLAEDATGRQRMGADLRAHQRRNLGIDRHVDRLLSVYADVAGRIAPGAELDGE